MYGGSVVICIYVGYYVIRHPSFHKILATSSIKLIRIYFEVNIEQVNQEISTI